jgi:esterase
MELYFRKSGEGAPLIILHGLFGSSDNWMSIAKVLSEQYTVYLPDQRNHGQSGNNDVFDYDSMAEDLKAFIEQHSIENPYIIGHSMGGKVAMTFASKYPELLRKLVVVDIAPKQYSLHHDTILEGLMAVDVNTIKSRGEADKQLAEYVPELGVRQFLLKNMYRTDEGGYAWRINLPVISRDIANIVQGLPDDARYEGDTLFIRGRNSNYIRDTDEELLRSHFPTMELITIENAGHWVHAEQPQEFTEHILQFLEK